MATVYIFRDGSLNPPRFRVWKDTDPGDQFYVIDQQGYLAIELLMSLDPETDLISFTDPEDE